jgi:hypothetical protein
MLLQQSNQALTNGEKVMSRADSTTCNSSQDGDFMLPRTGLHREIGAGRTPCAGNPPDL